MNAVLQQLVGKVFFWGFMSGAVFTAVFICIGALVGWAV